MQFFFALPTNFGRIMCGYNQKTAQQVERFLRIMKLVISSSWLYKHNQKRLTSKQFFLNRVFENPRIRTA